ncbi:hypothetical protein G6011_09397 [Alternaria panax]|uniref:Uncharacterized protein n=1 Tax=Alternaria panax TaxID=48097 RepID=A0AAD4IB75_9PLEO|nr:hypothetical protein G6011_09397 [Alternaria panax]
MAKSSLRRGISMLEELIEKTRDYDISQLQKDIFTKVCKGFIDMIKQGEDATPGTAREHIQRIQQSTPDWENILSICRSREARDLLQHFDLRVPLLVVLQLNDSPEPRSFVPMAVYKNIIRFRRYAEVESNIDIQDLYPKYVTGRLEIDTAFKRMNTPGGPPINFLDIRPVRRNVLPWESEGALD